jgi:primosomal protein N' (replication factor Y)
VLGAATVTTTATAGSDDPIRQLLTADADVGATTTTGTPLSATAPSVPTSGALAHAFTTDVDVKLRAAIDVVRADHVAAEATVVLDAVVAALRSATLRAPGLDARARGPVGQSDHLRRAGVVELDDLDLTLGITEVAGHQVTVVALLARLNDAVATGQHRAHVGASVRVVHVAVVALLHVLHVAVTTCRGEALGRAVVGVVGVAVVALFGALVHVAVTTRRAQARVGAGVGVGGVAVIALLCALDDAIPTQGTAVAVTVASVTVAVASVAIAIAIAIAGVIAIAIATVPIPIPAGLVGGEAGKECLDAAVGIVTSATGQLEDEYRDESGRACRSFRLHARDGTGVPARIGVRERPVRAIGVVHVVLYRATLAADDPSDAHDREPSERLVSVAVPVALARAFTYAVPPDLDIPKPGTRVLVPFGARALIGVVRPSAAERPRGRVRELLELLDPPELPALGEPLANLCEWLSDYYFAPIGECYRLALPASAMGVDVRRARLSSAGLEALEHVDNPLLARARGREPESLDAHEQRILAHLVEAGAGPSGRGLAVASLTGARAPQPAISGILQRLSTLASRGLVEIDTGEADSKRERTMLHYRRTDRLRHGSADEPAIARAVGRSKQRRALLDYLELQAPDTWTSLAELRGPFPRASALLAPLLEAGLVVAEERLRSLDPFASSLPARSEAPPLTEDQRGALAGLLASLESRRFHGALLHGITGSGKTEVYLHLIAAARAQGGGAIVLVPEIALTPQLADRFRARFGDEVAVLHSGLTPQQRLDAQAHIRAGLRPIVIGARSAVFAPVPDLRVIVVDEEHDASFKQEVGVRYNARDLALVRARALEALAVLGSATPSLETWHGAREQRLDSYSLRTRPTPRPLPEVEIIDLRKHMPNHETLLSDRLRTRLRETAAAGEQAILFLNRRGYTTALSCQSCGSFQQCPDCSSPSMTYHLARNRLMCHLCGHIEATPERCRSCGVGELEHGGAGTERVEIALVADLPGLRVARLDRDTSRGKALVELLDRFRRRELDVLIGTQMLAKGHDFPGVTLVGVLRADVGLALPDFRATERVFALLTQVAGRAGRGDRPGHVLIQTWAPDHPAIDYARRHDFEGFAELELAARARHGNPPFGHVALIRISGEQRSLVEARANDLGAMASQLCARVAAGGEANVESLGPVDSPIERINRRVRMQMLLRADRRSALRWVLRHLQRALGSQGRGASETVARVDVDPYSLL